MIGYRAREDLPESALIIEKAQAALKYVIKSAVMNRTQWVIVDGIVRKVIRDYTDQLKDETLKRKTRKGLLDFATIQYRRTKTELSPLQLGLFSAFSLLASKTTTEAVKAQAETVIKSRAPMMYQQALSQYREIAQPLRRFSKDYMQKVESTFRDLAQSEAKDSYSDRVSLRNVAEMTERWEQKQFEIEDIVKGGNDLVWISTHANCSERCAPWQGKLYSISGRSGMIDGIPFRPLSDAMDIFYTTKEGKTYRNGCISGFNCRHTLTPYKKGNKPAEIPSEVIDKQREIEDTQRAFERAIREKKAVAIGLKGINNEAARAYARQSRQLFYEYADYCEKNKVARYPARCKVFDGEELISPVYKRLLEKAINKLPKSA